MNDKPVKNAQREISLGAKIIAISIRSYIDDVMKTHANDITPKMKKALDFYNRISNQLTKTGHIDYTKDNGIHISGILEVLSDGMAQYSNKAKQTSTPSFVVVMLDWTANTIMGISQQIKTNIERENTDAIVITLPEEISFLFDTIQPSSW